MKIGYYPFENPNNKYIEISKNCLKRCGCDLIDYGQIGIRNVKETDAVILNWYESVGKRFGLLGQLLVVVKRILKLAWLKSQGVNIVFTFHNKLPHGTEGGLSVKLLRIYMKIVCKLASQIIIISRHSKIYLKNFLKENQIEEKAYYIPHPNYIGVYSDPLEENIYPVHNNFTVLFLGLVRKYKNVELIIEAARKYPQIHFIIAGKPESEKYCRELSKLNADMENVTLDLRFIEDLEMEQMIRDSDIMLLPYNLESSMNSGTVLLAFSNGRSVICPHISTLHDFDESLYYTYTYKDSYEHAAQINKNIEKAFHDWNVNQEEFEKKGTALLEAVKEGNSVHMLVKKYQRLLEKLM